MAIPLNYTVPDFDDLSISSSFSGAEVTKDCWLVLAGYLLSWKTHKRPMISLENLAKINSSFTPMYINQEMLPLPRVNDFYMNVCKFQPITKRLRANRYMTMGGDFRMPTTGDALFDDEFGYSGARVIFQEKNLDWVHGDLLSKSPDDKYSDFEHFVHIYNRKRNDNEIFEQRTLMDWQMMLKEYGPIGVTIRIAGMAFHMYVFYGYVTVKGNVSILLRNTADARKVILSWREFKLAIEPAFNLIECHAAWHVGYEIPVGL